MEFESDLIYLMVCSALQAAGCRLVILLFDYKYTSIRLQAASCY